MNFSHSKVSGLLTAFTSLKKECEKYRDEIEKEYWKRKKDRLYLKYSDLWEEYRDLVRALGESYEGLRWKFNSEIKEVELRYVDYHSSLNPIAVLIQIIIECNKAIGYLQPLISPISAEERDKLDSLRKEIALVEDADLPLFKHLTSAISEYEHGNYLAAALIGSKAVIYLIEQLPPKGRGNEEEKVRFLVSKDIIDEGLKDSFIKGMKRARNYFTHDIKAIPDPQDALGIISDACKLATMLLKIKVK